MSVNQSNAAAWRGWLAAANMAVLKDDLDARNRLARGLKLAPTTPFADGSLSARAVAEAFLHLARAWSEATEVRRPILGPALTGVVYAAQAILDEAVGQAADVWRSRADCGDD